MGLLILHMTARVNATTTVCLDNSFVWRFAWRNNATVHIPFQIIICTINWHTEPVEIQSTGSIYDTKCKNNVSEPNATTTNSVHTHCGVGNGQVEFIHHAGGQPASNTRHNNRTVDISQPHTRSSGLRKQPAAFPLLNLFIHGVLWIPVFFAISIYTVLKGSSKGLFSINEYKK